jgi:GT2 family glycosyltransferase
MPSKKILIVTPTLGTRDSLIETIASVDRFGSQVRHVIVCPPDKVGEVRAMVGAGREVMPERRKGGVYAAVNDILVDAAHDCDWIGYINDDDYWLDGMGDILDRSAHSEADIIYGRVEFVDLHGKHLVYSSSTGFYQLFPYLAAHGVYIFTQQAVLIRRSLFARLGGFDEQFRIQADNDFWIRAIASDAKCEYVDAVCAAYRVHDNQLTAGSTSLVERRRMLALNNLSSDRLKSRLALLFYRFANAPSYIARLARGGRSVRAEAGRVTN